MISNGEPSMPTLLSTCILFVTLAFFTSCSEERQEGPPKTFVSDHLSFTYPAGFTSASEGDLFQIKLSETAAIMVEYLEGANWLESTDFTRYMNFLQASDIAFGSQGMEKAHLEKPTLLNNHSLTGIYLQSKGPSGSMCENTYALDYGKRGAVFTLQSMKSEHGKFKATLMAIIRSATVK